MNEPKHTLTAVAAATHITPSSAPRLQRLFEATCDASPDRVALSFTKAQITYGRLEAAANQVAHLLRSRGVGRGGRVGVLLNRSARMYAAVLGILKCGAGFVPLDPAFPPDRVAYIAEDAGLAALLTTSDFTPSLKDLTCDIFALDALQPELHALPTDRPADEPAADADDLCYVIYTSGTTGRPKGVAISHGNACAYLASIGPVYDIRPTDRVFQGISLAFDFSVDEIWPAFAVGATLVPATSATERFGAGLAQLLERQRVTVLGCVPTLLSTIDSELPSLRLLIVGGEVCPPDLVRRWSRPGRRILNTYGPTETTVSATWTEVRPDQPVTIGRPLDGYYVHITDPETLRPLDDGAAGELLIGGPGVALGYVNRPDLTRERFIQDPCGSPEHRGGTVYRSGDLGRWNGSGEIEFLGRIDTQVKVRGYRIELAEIEAILRESPEVENAVVSPWPRQGPAQDLVAYLKARRQDRPPDVASLYAALRKRLPPYMVPAHVDVIEEIPLLPSGKVDRSRLPEPRGDRQTSAGRPFVAPANDLESAIAKSWSHVFKAERISSDSDFFLDLGGHSLYAAQSVSELRRDPRMANLSLADLYTHPTVRRLAGFIAASSARSDETASRIPEAPPTARTTARKRRSPWPAGFLQMGALYLLMAAIGLSSVAALVLARLVSLGTPAWGLAPQILAVAALAVAFWNVLPIAVKWIALGRARPGDYPVWGGYFVRWWIVQKALRLAPTRFLVGTPLMGGYLRLLGAKVGKDCYLGTAQTAVPDLLEIGAGTSIGYDTFLPGYSVRDGILRLGPTRIGAGCYVGSNSVLMPDSRMEDGARLGDQSLLAEGQTIPAGESWSGSPARAGPPDPTIEALAAQPTRPATRGRRVRAAVAFGAASCLLYAVPVLASIPGIALMYWADLQAGLAGMLAAALPAAGLFVVSLSLLIVGLKRALLPRIDPGTYSLGSRLYLRKWTADRLFDLGLGVNHAMYGTVYLAPWLRALGARVGKRAEVSTVSHITPNLLDIGEESFLADLVCAGPVRVHHGALSVAPTRIGRRTFLGNSSFMPAGASLSDNSLVGVLGVSPPHVDRPGTAWLGSPPIFLPRRQESPRFSDAETFRPTRRKYLQRCVYEFFRVTGPPTLWFASGALVVTGLLDLLGRFPLWATVLAFPALYAGAAFAATGVVLAVKWSLVRRYRPLVRPFYSRFVHRNELVTALYENVTAPQLLWGLTGTPFLPPVLRTFGMTIGRHVYLETTRFTEFDLNDIGDGAALAAYANIQTHLFEDRVLKMSYVRVGPGVSVGPKAVVLYDAILEDGVALDGLTLVMKGETLPARTRWRGNPAQLWRPSHAAVAP